MYLKTDYIYIHDWGAYTLLRYNTLVLDLTHLTNQGYNLKVDIINRRYNPMSYAIERYVRKVWNATLSYHNHLYTCWDSAQLNGIWLDSSQGVPHKKIILISSFFGTLLFNTESLLSLHILSNWEMTQASSHNDCVLACQLVDVVGHMLYVA